jgi:hypothetical protein
MTYAVAHNPVYVQSAPSPPSGRGLFREGRQCRARPLDAALKARLSMAYTTPFSVHEPAMASRRNDNTDEPGVDM